MPVRPLRLVSNVLMQAATLAAAIATLFLSAAPAAAQSEAALRTFFEGTHVTLKLDMPGTADGVDIRPGSTQPIDYKKYGDTLKKYGISIHAGDDTVVTLVRLKKDLIEFQLGGGGYGTFGDDTSTSVDMPQIDKSNREKDLEALVKKETDPARKRALQKELDDLVTARERENRRITTMRTQAEEAKKARIADARLKAGSRFNVRYTTVVPPATRPQDVMAALAAYVDFAPAGRPTQGLAPGAPAAPGAPPQSLRKGMLRADAERLLGRPVEQTERREGTLRVVTLVFVYRDERMTGEFVEDVLIRYTVSSK